MKSKLTLLFVLALVLSLVFAFSSCGNNDTDTNTNTETESETNTQTETETEAESDTDAETDTDTSTETVPSEPEHVHTEEILSAVEPTCTETGLTEGKKCAECGEILVAQAEISALNHDYVANDSKAPSCTEFGWKSYLSCSRCDYSSFEKIEATGHTEEIVTGYEATCTTAGLTDGKKCTICKDIILEQARIPTNDNHTDIQDVKGYDATCTETGLTDGKKCFACEKFTVEQTQILAKGHTEETLQAVEATCTKTGLTEGKKCSTCNDVLVAQAEIPVNVDNHINVETIVGYEPTCTETGLADGKKCNDCGSVLLRKEIIPANGHMKETIKGYDATCTEEGLSDGAKCTVCKETITEQTVIPAKGHTEEIMEGYEATCTETGLEDGKRCSVCGEILLRQAIIPTNDNHTDIQDVKGYEATCTETGLTDGKKCFACEKFTVEQTVVKAKGHAEEIIAGVEPTCTETGLTEGKKCSECGEILVVQTTIDALGHDGRTISAQSPTCMGIGWNAYIICNRCGYSSYNELSPLGHNMNADNECTRCDLSYSLNFILNDDENGYTVAGIGNYPDTNVVIPNTYKGLPVTQIADSAFEGNTSMTSITISENVTSIGSSALSGCTALAEINFNATAMDDLSEDNYVFYNAGKNGEGIKVTIGKEVTKIPAYLFCPYNYSTSPKIISVAFEEGSVCESIGNSAFENCDSLTSIEIPNSVTSIGNYAFHYWNKLTSVSYLGTIEGWCNIEFGDFYAHSLNLYISGELLTELVIPNTVTKINGFAFYNCKSITSITIPDSVTSIGDYAFRDCTSLTSVIIPDSVTSIGKYAFDNCTALAEINFNAKAMDDLSEDNYVFSNAGKNGEGIKVTIGKEVTKIPAYLFCPYGSSPKITSVTFEEGSVCENIGSYAFEGCTSLTSVTIGESVTSIGDSAFEGCTSLTSVTIGESVTSIGDSAFEDCTGLTSIEIPDSVTSIGSYALHGCTSLAYNEYINAYYLGNKDNPYLWLIKAKDTSITSCTVNENTRFIYRGAFNGCTGLTSVTIGDSVTSIGSDAFYNCTSLTKINFNAIAMDDLSCNNYLFSYAGIAGEGIKVTIGKNVTKIPAYLFSTYMYSSYSPKITSVEFEEGSVCESIGDYAFRNCTGLTSVTIGDSVTSIGYEAFRNCTGLTSIEIPDSVTSIGSYAFHGCTSLAYNEYDNAYYLGNEDNPYLWLIKAKDTSITSCTINENTKIIYRVAFEDCTSLTSVTIGDSVTSIGYGAFYECDSLTSVTIPSSVTNIGDYAFQNCTSLTRVTFDDADGWYVTSTEGATSGMDIDLTNASTNATYLKSMYEYYYWYKK